jgi:hypothetical protein
LQHLLLECLDYNLFVTVIPQLDNVRNYVVSVLVFRKIESTLEALVKQRAELILRALFYDPLHHATAERMHRHLVDLAFDQVD